MREKGQKLKRVDRNICGTIRILSENFMKIGPAIFEKLRGHIDRQTHIQTHTHTTK